jgi:hypothetical protein
VITSVLPFFRSSVLPFFRSSVLQSLGRGGLLKTLKSKLATKTSSMKTLKLIFILSILIFSISACQKEESEAVTGDPSIGNSKVGDNDMNLRFMYTFWNCDDILWGGPCDMHVLGCAWPPDNCLPTANIRGEANRSDLQTLLNKIESNSYDEFFRSDDYLRTFGSIRNHPNLHSLLINRKADFVVQRDTANDYLYLVGFDNSVSLNERSKDDIIIAFEIDEN